MNAGYILQMSDISKAFGPVRASINVTFNVRRGTVHALVGENGAGKSTLMKVLAGVHEPDTGSIRINEKPASFAKPMDALQAGIAMIYQELDLAEHLTVTENVFLGDEIPGRFPFTIDSRKMREQTGELAKEYGFKVDADALISELSTGDCQVVEVLKALRRSASIIVMDEPTSSLSEAEAASLFKVIRKLRDSGITIIYISHRLEEITGLADDVTVLRDGGVVHTGSMAEMSIAGIIHHMVGRELEDFYPERKTTIGETVFSARDLQTDRGIAGVSFEIKAGQVVGMAGLVGAGRTDVARAVFGVDKLGCGSLYLNGREVRISGPGDAIRSGIAYLTEDRKRTGLCLNLACSWNVTLPNLSKIGMGTRIDPGKEDRIATEIAARVAVKWASPQAPADSLSGGNQQKLLVARWLLAESKLLIFDEPTRGIDVGAKQDVYVLLNELAERGKAILFISSELPELFGVTDRVLVMRRGRLVGNFETKKTNPDEIMHLAAVEEK